MKSHILIWLVSAITFVFLAACLPSHFLQDPASSQVIENELALQNALTLQGLQSATLTPKPSSIDNPAPNASASADSYYDRGMDYANRGIPFLAIRNFDQAIEINPDFTLAYFHAGMYFLL